MLVLVSLPINDTTILFGKADSVASKAIHE